MASVTQRIREIKQPWGGFVRPRAMRISHPGDGDTTPIDSAEENIPASVVGTAVDYLTRLATGTNPNEAFKISLLGAMVVWARCSE